MEKEKQEQEENNNKNKEEEKEKKQKMKKTQRTPIKAKQTYFQISSQGNLKFQASRFKSFAIYQFRGSYASRWFTDFALNSFMTTQPRDSPV